MVVTYIIVIRMSNEKLCAISDDNNIAEFTSYKEAEELMSKHSLKVFDWEIIEIMV